MSNNAEILISVHAIAKILAIDSIDTTKESAGVLIGKYNESENKLIITDIDTGKQRQTSTFVVLDDEALVEMVEELNNKGRDEYIVGWWHAHPGYGAFLSGTDKGTQRIYQQLFPKAVAMVVDPSRYYKTNDQKNLEIAFFRMINDFDYKAISFNVYYDDVTRHLLNIATPPAKIFIPTLDEEEVKRLRTKLGFISDEKLPKNEKMLVNTVIDVLQKTKTGETSSEEKASVLESLITRFNNILGKVEDIYEHEVSAVYSVLNVIAAIIIVLSWFLIAFYT